MSENAAAAQERSVEITREQIADYVRHLGEEKFGEASIAIYRRNLEDLYGALPADKRLRCGTLRTWRERLLEEGYAARTINQRVNVANGFLNYLGFREFQLTGGLATGDEVIPELTRWEYLRLLETAKQLGRKRTYLFVKVFAITGLPVQSLEKLTVAAVRRGRFSVEHKLGWQQVHIPRSLQEELLDYARRNACTATEPVFLTRTGKPVHRNYVNAELRRLCLEAGVAEEKGSPRCLRRLFFKTREEIESSVRAQVEQSYERMLDREQASVGWNA